jgi:hypothetical protein
MAQRLVRAKGKIRDARIPYRVPSEADMPERLASVLAVVYLIFNEGYAASSGDLLIRDELAAEAIRLGRLLAELMPDEPEVLGLLALMLLLHSRRPARTTEEGELVPLPEQDRSLWDGDLIEEGHALVKRCLRQNQPAPYQLQAAINAVHSDAPTASETDWNQILVLYDQLLRLTPTAIVALNRAVAVAEVHGPREALELIDGLSLAGYSREPGRGGAGCSNSRTTLVLAVRRVPARVGSGSRTPGARDSARNLHSRRTSRNRLGAHQRKQGQSAGAIRVTEENLGSATQENLPSVAGDGDPRRSSAPGCAPRAAAGKTRPSQETTVLRTGSVRAPPPLVSGKRHRGGCGSARECAHPSASGHDATVPAQRGAGPRQETATRRRAACADALEGEPDAPTAAVGAARATRVRRCRW